VNVVNAPRVFPNSHRIEQRTAGRLEPLGEPAVDRSERSRASPRLPWSQSRAMRVTTHVKCVTGTSAASGACRVRQAFLSEARLGCTMKLLSSGLIVAALFCKTGQRCAMEALPLRLDLAGVLGVNARYDAQ